MAGTTDPSLDPDLIDACGTDPGRVCEQVHDWTGNETLAEVSDWLVGAPLRIFLIVVLGWVAIRLLQRTIDRFVGRLVAERTPETPPDDDLSSLEALGDRAIDRLKLLADQAERSQQRTLTLGAVLRGVAGATIGIIALFMVMSEVGISLGPLIAGAGIAGVALGFGAQSLVRDFLVGMFIIIEDQYGVGDIVDLGDAVGEVESVSLRTTRVRDVQGALWIVPNGEITRVANMSQLWSRALLDVEVAYDTDIDHAIEVIGQVVDEVWTEQVEDATVLSPPAVLGVQSFGASAIVIRTTIDTEPAEQFATARLIRKRLKEAFDREGIEIPFPQHDVWLRTAPEPETQS